MKTKVLSITILLCTLHTICAFCATTTNYKVQKGTNETKIEVFGDCDIVVADIAPVKNEIIYGDRVGGTAYGGTSEERFKQQQVIPNEKKKGIDVHRVDNRVVLSFKYAQLENTEIQIFSAVYKDSLQAKPDKAGYFPGTSFKISVIKGGTEGKAIAGTDVGASIPEGQTVDNTFDIMDLRKSIEGLSIEVSQLKEAKELYNYFPLLIALLIGLLFGYFLFIQNRKFLKDLSKECSDLKEVVDNWEKKNVQVISRQTTLQKNKGESSMTDDDIKRFIVEQIKSLQTQFSPSTLQPTIATNSNFDSVANSVKKEEQTTDTDNVKYHQDDNSFSLEQTDIKIFRIYSKKGEYYYTIVDDSSVREELIGMLQMFEGCITYQTTYGEAKRVEPVTEGKLRKDGNKFYIDANNKLVVRFA